MVPVRFLNSSPARWADVPAPCEANDSLPGAALAAAMMRLCLALLVIAGLLFAPSAMSSSADDQDACRIGAVSPEEYRTIAAVVAAMPAIN